MKRYSPWKRGDMIKDSLGDWVRYEDAKKVVDALEMLLKECEAFAIVIPAYANSEALNAARAALKQINGE